MNCPTKGQCLWVQAAAKPKPRGHPAHSLSVAQLGRPWTKARGQAIENETTPGVTKGSTMTPREFSIDPKDSMLTRRDFRIDPVDSKLTQRDFNIGPMNSILTQHELSIDSTSVNSVLTQRIQ